MGKQTTTKIKQKKNILRKNIYHNRWLIWAVFFSFVVLVGLIGYIRISNINLENNIFSNNAFKSWRSYKDTRLGFSLRYPTNWSIEAESETTVNFIPPGLTQNGVSITVLEPKTEKIFRKTLDIIKEQNIKIGDFEATKIYNSVSGRGFESVVIIKTDKKLYIIRGDDTWADKILLTFKPII